MEELRDILLNTISDTLYQAILSNPQNKNRASKVKIRPVMIRESLVFQETTYLGTQVFHQNRNKEETINRIITDLETTYRQCEVETTECRVNILVSKKGKMTIKKMDIKISNEVAKKQNLSHNRVKKYILEEGVSIPFLIELGIMTAEGQIVRSKYDKFKQINRYLEFIQDILPTLPKDRIIHIIDFGCGKSYLTFALYYYLHEINKLPVDIIGLDLKKEVIHNCEALARKYGYESLHFQQGDIAQFEKKNSVDMVVTLHACDTATDYALAKAVEWDARVILSVPCCQHEVNGQIQCEPLSPILKYGLIKERISALMTDAIRANLLEAQGYETQILEFIDMEHTPKNILIRAVKRNGELPGKTITNINEVAEFLHIETTLQKLFHSYKI